MQQLKSALVVEYGYMRLLLFKKRNGVYSYFNEEKVDYDGFNAGGFINPDDVFSKIQRLFSAAENYGSIDKIALVLLPGVFFGYGIDEKETDIPGGAVTVSDADALLYSCGQPLNGYEAVQRRALNYMTLSNPSVKNPVGERTELLRVTASVEYLKRNIKELFDNCEKRLGKRFDCTSFGAVACSKAEEGEHAAQRVLILLSDGNIDIVLSKDGVPIDVRSDLIGSRHIMFSLAEELKCTDDIAEEILLGVNLNLNFSDGDKYTFGSEKYPVPEINTFLAETFIYIADGAKRCLESFGIANKLPIAFTGSDVCAVRGVKDLFEDEIGGEVRVLYGDALNLEGCGNYVAASVEALLRRNDAANSKRGKRTIR